MSDDPLEQPTPVTPVTDQRDSVWAALREEHVRVSADRDPLYLTIPGYEQLVGKYRYVPLEEMKATNEALMKIRDVTDNTRIASLDGLIHALDELLFVSPDGTVPTGKDGRQLYDRPVKPLAIPGEAPIRFDEQLASNMGWEDASRLSARQIVRRLFGGDDRAIIAHAGDVGEWMTATRDQIRSELEKG